MNQQTAHDELDLLDMFEILWNGKWLIMCFMAVAMTLGFGFSQLSTQKYKVKVNYKVIVPSVYYMQICENSLSPLECISDGVYDKFNNFTGAKWVKSKRLNLLTLRTTAPTTLEEYKSYFTNISKRTTDEILAEAKAELHAINNDLHEALRSTDRVAVNMMNATRIVNLIEDGKQAVRFGTPRITSSVSKTMAIVSLAAFVGGVLGSIFVLFNCAFRKRKEIRETKE